MEQDGRLETSKLKQLTSHCTSSSLYEEVFSQKMTRVLDLLKD